jgi:hypothetical protein
MAGRPARDAADQRLPLRSDNPPLPGVTAVCSRAIPEQTADALGAVTQLLEHPAELIPDYPTGHHHRTG